MAELEQRPLSARAQIAREYDTYVAEFVAGEYGRAELAAHERRGSARSLQAAAKRRGLALRFHSDPDLLTFHVETAPPSIAQPTAIPASGAEQQHDGTARHDRDGAPP
jgi:hypothetical protein